MSGYKHNLENDTSDNYLDSRSPLTSIASMAKGEMSLKIGTAIKTARKRRGLVQRNIAERLKIEVAAVGMWESGRNLPSTENLMKAADVLQVDPSALARGELIYLDGEYLADAEIVTDPGLAPSGPMDIRLMGVAYGGDDGDFTFNGEVSGYVRRPPGLTGLRNVFALSILSDSMIPRYDPGDVIYCGGREPVPGDHVVIELAPEIEGQPGKAFIKKLSKRTGAEIIAEQYNPPETLTFQRPRVKNLWRVIPLKELFGF